MLKVNNIDVFYGKVQALHGVTLELEGSEIVAIIGANGAGKTTLMKTVMGLLKPQNGSIEFEGVMLSKLKTHQIVQRRITSVPEGRRILPKLSVKDNLEMGAYSRKLKKAQLNEELDRVTAIFPRLKERFKQLGGTLSGGEQQMLAIARGLMNQPSLLLLDEPSLGLAPIIVDEMFDIIKNINAQMSIPILLVEQNAYSALEVSSRCYVLEVGEVVKSGPSQEMMNSPDIVKAYLGG